MVTLADVRTAMVYDLPPGTTKQPHWLNAGMLVVAASESGKQGDIHVATDAITDALDVEGWLSRRQSADARALMRRVLVELMASYWRP